MPNHQFAIVPTHLTQIQTELTTIHFVDHDNDQLPADQLFHDLICRALVNYQTPASKEIALADLMVDATTDAHQFFSHPQTVTPTHFYNLALQLLHFQTNEDFKLTEPLAAWQRLSLNQIKLPDDSLDPEAVLTGWYQLLNTHTKFGQTYLDDLAANGYLAQFTTLPKPLIFNGKTQAVFNSQKLIREVVYVESDLDIDHDGKRDLLMAHVIRPAETETGLKVPTLYTASPYDQGTNDIAGAQLTHNVDHPIEHKTPNHFELTDVQNRVKVSTPPSPRAGDGSVATQAEEHFQTGWGYTLNNYFLARGFAVVYAAGIGTKGSEGLRTTGDEAETKSTTAIIEWLDGKRQAFTNRAGTTTIKAWWSNHHIGMTGRSYLGTLQTAAATTGVAGLKTCISEAAISSWYDYYRENGLVVAPGGFQGEDADVLAEETFSREQRAGDYQRIQAKWHQQLATLTRDQDRHTGNYNQFWDARNYLKDVANIKADMVLVHGLNDWNVKPKNVANLYQALKTVPVTTKLFLHQGQHIYINNFQSLDFTDMMNLWLTHKLWDVDNHAKELIPAITIQDNVTPNTWHSLSDWATNQHPLTIRLNDAQQLAQTYPEATPAFFDQITTPQLKHYTQHEKQGQYDEWLHDLIVNPASPIEQTRLIFKSKPLSEDLTIDGRVRLNLSIATDANVGLISAMLIDYGTARRFNPTPTTIAANAIQAGFQWTQDSLKEFTLETIPSQFKMISIGHLNMQNRHNSYRVDELVPNQYYDLTLELQPTFYTIPAGRQFGIVIYATDLAMTLRGTMGVTYHLNSAQSTVTIPRYHNHSKKW